jgi:N-carbamoyl-D-amino-acid hydrolase
MARHLRVAAAQLGPIPRAASRPQVVRRLLSLMEEAAGRGADLVVYPELALTSFFPRWALDDESLDTFFESSMPGPITQPLFDAARRLGVGFCLGYAERERRGDGEHRFNSAVLVDQGGSVLGHYRKIHLPGDRVPIDGLAFQHLEKRYFETGDQGFGVWRTLGGVLGMLICNDRRWPEAWRVLGLQGVELVLVGYNTPQTNPEAPEHDRWTQEQHRLVMRAGAYQNATWAVAVAKGGCEEGVDMLADTIIVSPSGEIVAQSCTLGDELVMADCDLDQTLSYKRSIFDFAAHREPSAYRSIVERKGAVPPLDTGG